MSRYKLLLGAGIALAAMTTQAAWSGNRMSQTFQSHVLQAINPQPLPPSHIPVRTGTVQLTPGATSSLNPQPLPPMPASVSSSIQWGR
jgi:hypothetical protein